MEKKDIVLLSLLQAAREMRLEADVINRFICDVSTVGEEIENVLEKQEIFKGTCWERFLVQAASLQKNSEKFAKELTKRKIGLLSVLHPRYPQNLKIKLGEKAPPCFLTVGNIAHTAKKSVAVTGVRDVMWDDVCIAKRLGELCAKEQLVVVSGGATGVDSLALEAVLEAGGCSVVYLPQGFETSTFVQKNKKYIEGGNLLCLTLCLPDKKFSSEAALSRNKFIHCHGDITVTVRAKYKQGGSWAGAKYNLEKGFTPAFVCDISSPGNEELAIMGAEVLKREEMYRQSFSLREKIKG